NIGSSEPASARRGRGYSSYGEGLDGRQRPSYGLGGAGFCRHFLSHFLSPGRTPTQCQSLKSKGIFCVPCNTGMNAAARRKMSGKSGYYGLYSSAEICSKRRIGESPLLAL